LSPAERRDGARTVELRPPPLERQERNDLGGPSLGRERYPRVERVSALELRREPFLELTKPVAGEDPASRPLQPRRRVAYEVTERFEANGGVDSRRDVASLEERHPILVPMPRWRGVENDSTAECRLAAQDHAIASRR